MPGPRNAKSRKKVQAKKSKRAKPAHIAASPSESSPTTSQAIFPSPPPAEDTLPPSKSYNGEVELTQLVGSLNLTDLAPTQRSPLPPDAYEHQYAEPQISNHPRIPSPFDNALVPEDHSYAPDDTFVSLMKPPFIEDPGTGIRVRDTHEFLTSRFAAPPSLDDELCAEFAQEEVLQMLCSVLPEETALILWYNKSRMKARICPACQRLYRLGDILHDPLGPTQPHEDSQKESTVSENRLREQQISGLCSPVCFILAAFNYPAAIRSTWGRMAEDLSDETWELLGTPPAVQANDMGLGMLLKMTRCHDLGLGQLLFPDLDLDDEGPYDGSDVQDEFDEEIQSDESADRYEEDVSPADGGMWHNMIPKGELDAVADSRVLEVRVAQVDDNEPLRR